MHRHAGGCQVVVADRLHAHHREQAAQRRQFLGGADANRAVALLIQALDFAGSAQLRGHRRVAGQHLGVGAGHQFHQGAVQRHFFAVHVRHRPREALADQVRADDVLVAHKLESRRSDSGVGRFCSAPA
ncbi:hypothetical protein D3C76_1301270 [compost metagenome]